MSRFSVHLYRFLSVLAWSCGGFVVFVAFLFAPKTWAANGSINQQISYQAKLMDTSGSPVADGNNSIKFSVYDASLGGNRLWTATGTLASPGAINVSSTSGLLTVNFGDTSAGGQWQNALPTTIWNNDALFLGVTVGADAEMTPRRRLTSAPQAFNSMQLQGMYASGTAYGNASVFSINQTETSAATGTRAALFVQTHGTSPTNDFIIRGANSAGTGVFSVDIGGGISTSGTVTSTASYTTTFQSLNASSTNATATSMALTTAFNHILTQDSVFVTASSSAISDGPTAIQVVGKYAYVVSQNDNKLSIYDLTNPSSASSVGSVVVGAGPLDVFVDGRYAYTVNGTDASVSVVDISSPKTPVVVKTVTGPVGVFSPQSIAVRGGYVYFPTATGNSLLTIDARKPDQARIVSASTDPGGDIIGLMIQGRYAYAITDLSGLVIFDLMDPMRPKIISQTGLPTLAKDIKVQGKYAYITNSAVASALRIYDISNPAAPSLVSTAATTGVNSPAADGVTVAGRYVYLPGATGLAVLDVQDPTNPTQVKYFALPAASSGMAVSGRYAYTLIPSIDKLIVVDIGGIETVGVKSSTVETGLLQVLSDGRIGNQLTIDGGISVGRGGIFSDGQLSVNATNTTSSIMGNLVVGTTTVGIALNSLFVTDGDDFFVGGNIGSVSSVYTNGAFVAGSGSTWYGNGFINQNSGNLTLQASGGYILPSSDLGVSFGSSALRYNGYFGDVTSTNVTTTNFATTNFSVTGNGTTTFSGGLKVNGNVSSTWLVSDQGLMVRGKSLFVDPATGNVGIGTNVPANKLEINGGMSANTASFGQIEVTYTAATSDFWGGVVVGTSTYGGGLNATFGSATTTFFVQGEIGSTTSVYSNGAFVAGQTNPLYVLNNVINQTSGNLTLNAAGGYIRPASDMGVSLGSSSFRYNGYFGDVTSTSATTTNFATTNFAVTGNSTTTFSGGLQVNGNVSSTWLVSDQGLMVRGKSLFVDPATGYVGIGTVSPVNALSVNGGLNASSINSPGTITSSLFESSGAGTSTFAANMTVGTTTYGGGLYSLFGSATRTLFVDGEIGSASSVYTNGTFVAGQTNPLYVLSNVINQTSGNLTLNAAGGYILPASNMGVSLGSNSLRYNGYFGDVTSTSATTTNLSTTRFDATDATSTNLNAVYLTVGNQGIVTTGGITSSSSSVSTTSIFVNTASAAGGSSWGAYINRLLVGSSSTATGTASFSAAIVHNSDAGFTGLCIDDEKNNSTCLPGVGASIQADGTVNSNAFDLAEQYAFSGVVNPGDVLVLDAATSSTVMASTGIAYDGKITGIASTNPGFLLGFYGGAKVALAGRVPVKFSPANGSVSVGDPLTSSRTPGMAMKATKPGRIIGYALEASSVTSTVETFVKVGYEAGMALNTDGTVTQITDDVVVAPRAIATAVDPTQDSWGFTFRGSAWDGTQAVTTDFTLANDVLSSTSSQFTLRNNLSSSIFSVDQTGTARVAGDLIVGGRLFPSAAGVAQTDTYLFVDRTSSPTSTYIATNADGWQSNTSYDFAERYYSPDVLEPGDLVVVSRNGRIHVQRAWDEKTSLIGIVSTRPGFVAGAPATSTYPIALAGRVPTKVSTVKGAIHAGDLLAPSTIPGVAVKATEAGPIVGQALETYDSSDIGKIETFVNPGWWGGAERDTQNAQRVASDLTPNKLMPNASPSQRGIALITSGSKQVRITFPSLLAFPSVQVTPRGEVDGGWWTDHYSDTGFEILLKQAQTHDVVFMWSVEALQDNERAFVSDGTMADIHPQTGEILAHPSVATSTTAVAEEPSAPTVTTPTATTTETEPSSSTTTEPQM